MKGLAEPLVWFLISFAQLYVGCKLILTPHTATVYDYALVGLVSVPLILEYVIKKVRRV